MTVSAQRSALNRTEAIRRGFRLALERAVPTLGATAPNPSVACVLLDKNGDVLSVGVHEAAGQPHAEAMALEKARQDGVLERAHDALVTLEPCAHYGRTPPCSERLRHSPVQTVWIGARDPNPVAAGGGASLQQGEPTKRVVFLDDVPDYAEIAQQCRALLAPFASRVTRGRPWLTVKQALDVSGNMEPPAGQKTFTSPASLTLAHQVRRATDAIVTGVGTVLADQPSFTVRHVEDHHGRKPRLLIVMDRQGRLPAEWKEARERDGFVVETCTSLAEMPLLLGQQGINWALIEGGPTLLKALEDENLWDDWLTIQQGQSGAEDRITWRQRDETQGLQSPLTFFQKVGNV